jgi:hypothetical protein
MGELGRPDRQRAVKAICCTLLLVLVAATTAAHISLFMRDRKSGDWIYMFTQEWPVLSQTHQLSYTIPLVGDGSRGVGDVLVNYRYQLIGSGDTALAIAPRLSLILPTGDENKGAGRGVTGLQALVPISRVVAMRVASHSDAGATWYHDGNSAELFLAQSFIYAASARVHLMAEATWSRAEHETEVLISPGVRWAYNFRSGLQIVPGGRSIIMYLSFEHPFVK